MTSASPCSRPSCHLSFLVSFHFSQASCPKGLAFLDLLCPSESTPSSFEGRLINHLYYIGWDLLLFNSFRHNSCQMVITRQGSSHMGLVPLPHPILPLFPCLNYSGSSDAEQCRYSWIWGTLLFKSLATFSSLH